MHKIILFELNEVPVKILNQYIKLRPKSALASLVKESRKFESFTENKGHLSPWNTWPTLHRGVTNEKHFIHDFGQNLHEVDKEYAPIWELLSQQGISVGMFGSLHSYPLPEQLNNYKFYVPDVFASGPECHPKSIEVFQNFNLTLSRESIRNVSKRTPVLDGLKLMANIHNLGFKLGTLGSTAGQIIEEKLNPWKTVRRRTYQSVLAFDVFMKQLNDKKPDFVTYFTNHVASSMHRFWAAAFPEEYKELPYDQDWLQTYQKEILFTMDATDKMISRLVKFLEKNTDYKLVITSSMGQDAVEPKAVHTSLFIKDADKFMSQLGISKDAYRVKPAMFPQFNIELLSSSDKFEDSLKELKIQGEPISFRQFDRVFSLDFGHQLSSNNEKEISLRNQHYAVDELGLENVQIEDRCGSSAYHIPEGIFLVYHPSFKEENPAYRPINTVDVVPMLMKNFGLKTKNYMAKVSEQQTEAVLG